MCALFLAVENLLSVAVKNYAEIEQRIAQGTKNRTVASTNMNATSSRAHTIVAINFKQKTKNTDGQMMQRTSIINLVDLAGRFVQSRNGTHLAVMMSLMLE